MNNLETTVLKRPKNKARLILLSDKEYNQSPDNTPKISTNKDKDKDMRIYTYFTHDT